MSSTTCLPASTVIAQHTGTHGCLLFCDTSFRDEYYAARKVRQIATLAARNDTPLAGFGIFGVVKEVTGVDDVGLTEFYDNYFTYPIYKDESLIFYTMHWDYVNYHSRPCSKERGGIHIVYTNPIVIFPRDYEVRILPAI